MATWHSRVDEFIHNTFRAAKDKGIPRKRICFDVSFQLDPPAVVVRASTDSIAASPLTLPSAALKNDNDKAAWFKDVAVYVDEYPYHLEAFKEHDYRSES